MSDDKESGWSDDPSTGLPRVDVSSEGAMHGKKRSSIRKELNRIRSSVGSLTSRPSVTPIEILHMSGSCDKQDRPAPSEDGGATVTKTTSLSMHEDEEDPTSLKNIGTLPLGNPMFSASRLQQRPSFAGYHKCRARSMSLPQGKLKAQLMDTYLPTEVQLPRQSISERNTHRTASGMGLVSSIVADEESKKSKILSMFEANITNNQIKTFYGGVVGVLEDRQRQDRILHEERKLIIHPLSTFRLVWDTLLMIAICLTMLILPIKLAFFKIFDDEISSSEMDWYPIVIIVDIIYIIDVILSFFTGTINTRVHPPEIILDREAIQRQYLRSWFLPDLISSIPYDVIGSELANSTRDNDGISIAYSASKVLVIAKTLKIFSLLRVLRLGRLHFLTKRWTQIFEISPLVSKIVQLMGLFCTMAHWSACIQFFVVYVRNFPEKSWPALLGIQESPVIDQYLWSLFRSLSHMITIGYGRDTPQEVTELIFIIPSMLTGAFFYMMIVSQMTKTISLFKMGSIRYTQKLKDVDEIAKKYGLDSNAHQRLHEFYHHKYSGEIHDDEAIMNELSLALKVDVIKARYRDVIENVFFLSGGDDGLIEQFILSIKRSVFMTGDIIIRSDDTVDDLYVIQKGTVSVEFTTPGCSLDDDIIVREFGFFGETPLLTKKKANMMVFAEVPCDCLLIPKYMFYTLLDRHPLFKNQMLLVCHSRLTLQGLSPIDHAPFLENAFLDALSDPDAVNSSEDILELASQARLDSKGMQAFREQNLHDLSAFRRQKPSFDTRALSSHTPIDLARKEKEVHVSVSIHGDQVKAHCSAAQVIPE